jgi:hypothetical protein
MTSVRASRIALTVTLALALSACGGGAAPTGGATTGPVQPDDSGASAVPESTPAAGDSSGPQAPASTAIDDGVDRPASIHLDLSATDTSSDGSYTSSGPARLCGDAEVNLTGNLRAFNFEFPHSGDYEIVDVTFGADDLVSGAATSSFHLGVTVHAKAGGEPPATIVDTSNSGNSGTAQLSDSSGTTTLTVDGTDDIGQTIHMVATCGPRG